MKASCVATTKAGVGIALAGRGEAPRTTSTGALTVLAGPEAVHGANHIITTE